LWLSGPAEGRETGKIAPAGGAEENGEGMIKGRLTGLRRAAFTSKGTTRKSRLPFLVGIKNGN